MLNLYDYKGGIANKQLVAAFDRNNKGEIVVYGFGDKSNCARTLYGEYQYKQDYINSVFVRLYRHWPDETKTEYRYVYDYEKQKTPVACIVKQGGLFGYSVVSDKKNAIYNSKILLPEEIQSHRFSNGEYLTPLNDENGALSGYVLQSPISWAGDSFNYKAARQIAHNHLGRNTLIPRRSIVTLYGYTLSLEDVINEIANNWWTV